MQRHVGLELARPREDVGLIDPVFDDPSELGVTRAPAALLSHMGKSKWGPLPCPPEGEGNLGPHPTLPPDRGRDISAKDGKFPPSADGPYHIPTTRTAESP